MKVYLVTWLYEPSQKESLDKKQESNRLLSYFFCIDQGKNCLRDYTERRQIDEGRKRGII